jgi:cis-3-alkyl-4-acyloxetan-2-one decarboxylase
LNESRRRLIVNDTDRRHHDLPDWLLNAYPFERTLIEVNGWQMNVVDTGTGRPVLLMHGNPMWSYLWRKIIPHLVEAGFRVIAPDMIGLGLSQKPRHVEDHSFDFHRDNLVTLVEKLDLNDMIIVGQDWGGPQVAGMAARCPERVTGAVFGNTSLLPPDKRAKATRFHRFANRPFISTFAFRVLNFPIPILKKVQGDPTSMGAEELRAYRYPLDSWANRAAPLALARMVPTSPQHPSIPGLKECGAWTESFAGPVALVWGLRDPILGRSLNRMRRTFPDAPVTETQAGHFLQEEVPEEIVAAITHVDSSQ